MKNLSKNIIVAGFLLLSMASCKKELDIQPRQSISSGVALATTADVQNALIGAYTVLATGDLYGTNLVFVPDLYAGNGYLNWTGSFSTYRDIANKSIIATNVDVNRTWTSAYKAINAPKTALLVEKALGLFPNESYKDDLDNRNKQLAKMDEMVFSGWEDLDELFFDEEQEEDIVTLIVEFIRENKDKF